jgi:2-keto-4-pentenoate hydratase/2-oxohepta-3-ene-1,7-dioic acid hydratase in catechol pathway
MKFASFEANGVAGWGMIDGDEIADLSAVRPDLKSALPIDPARIVDAAKSAPRIRLADVTLAPVVPDAGKILCVGHNYESHRVETGRDKTEHPSIFIRFADSMVGHGCPIVRPRASTMLDYEGELAVVIGKPGRAIEPGRALEYVAGYTCFNDASLRDWQWHTKQFTPGKNFPGTGACGPWMVTADEVPDPSKLHVTTRLNGEVMQSQPTAEMIFPIPEIIAYVSAFTPLARGDLIATGTPGGVGARRQPPVWMKPGDTVEVEIPGVGVLLNVVTDEQ